jgi:hypothetical protein
LRVSPRKSPLIDRVRLKIRAPWLKPNERVFAERRIHARTRSLERNICTGRTKSRFVLLVRGRRGIGLTLLYVCLFIYIYRHFIYINTRTHIEVIYCIIDTATRRTRIYERRRPQRFHDMPNHDS